MNRITFTLNGRAISVADADPHTTLLHYLRSAGLTGAKEGCGEGECGACAVVLVQPGPDGTARYVPVNSCLLLLPLVAGQEVWTVEGLARDGHLHPVQAAMGQGGASQCGYCTPGFVMTLFAEFYRPGRTDFDPEALSGNLCRCTGYRPVRDAARSLGAPAEGDFFLERLEQPSPPRVPLDYVANGSRIVRPERLEEVVALLAAEPGAQVVAGATDLGVAVSQHYHRWPLLVSLEAVPELKRLAFAGEYIEIGAGVTLSELEERLEGRVPLLAELFPRFASRLVRNRATLGGNLAAASPIGDAAPVLLALGAEVRVTGAAGERILSLDRFFTGYRRNALQPSEVIVSLRLPLPLPRLSRFYKVAKRRRDDISTVSAAFALDVDEASRRILRVRLAYGGVAATPVRAHRAEEALVGRVWDEESVRAAQAVLAEEFEPLSDHRGSAGYRRAMVANLLQKCYTETEGVPACRKL